MLKIISVFSFLMLVLSSSTVDVNVSNYVSRRRAETAFWDKHFIRRYLMEERLIISMARAAISGLVESLNNILYLPEQELKSIVKSLATEACVNDVLSILGEQRKDATSKFEETTKSALRELQKNLESWEIKNRDSKIASERIQKGYDMCAELYPNLDYFKRLKACLEFQRSFYFKDTKQIHVFLQPSPVMDYFQSVVVRSADEIAQEMRRIRNYAIQALFDCNEESETDLLDYTDTLKSCKTYNLTDTLYNQLEDSRLKTSTLVATVEEDLRKLIKTRNMVEELQPRTVSEYQGILEDHLTYEFHVLWTAYTRHPTDKECLPRAREKLEGVINKAVRKYQELDQRTFNDARTHVRDMDAMMESVIYLLPASGDSAILACMADGDIFEDNAVRDSFDESTGDFWFTYRKVHETILTKIAVVEQHINRLTNNTIIDEESPILNTASIEAVEILLGLKNCLKDRGEFSITEDVQGTKSVSIFEVPRIENHNFKASNTRTSKEFLYEQKRKSEGMQINNEPYVVLM